MTGRHVILLERVVENLDRQAHWQKVYEGKSPSEVSWFQSEPTVSLDFIHQCGLKPSDPIIDAGGGASVLVDHLLDEGYSQLTVLDVSGAALAASRKRLGTRAGQVEWIESDVTSYAPKRRFALWHDRAAFHFLTDPTDRRGYVSALGRALMPGGHLIIASFAIGGPERCSGLPIVQYDSKRLLGELGSGFRLTIERSETHVTPAGHTQEFAYFLLDRIVEEDLVPVIA